ncbi:NhaP-type Na+/H+ or K+/H+ antiporter [Nannocystis exedens]|uniref:NhaP-type Na+/H+ or K+/H+ antiporter n=1 Tax=Nannocystis exedens TaxID=54 RepID=A0A1I1Y8S1_9BACT|nr:cation:proton antiporter [Nannocystis exedens]PCC71899.1 potassium/proton antiporter [Nannocystis exedens]SFE16035.1 NhaP-type Na+/H+ or K+/H+ antiporter [Nannocystis exedens]
MAPVTVFLVAIACLLAAAAAVRPLALRTHVPEAVWLIALGVVLRTTGLVPPATIAALAPFFAALALIIVLFEAGRDMVFGTASEQVVRARKLALAGAALVVPLVALFSQALSGLHLLPVWSWTHAFMLGALLLCTAPEVFAPTLYRRAHPGLVAALEREAALTGALAIAATACCIDLLSLRVPVGKAYAAIAAGFGLGLAFGAFAGLLWITAIRRVGPGRGVYPYTLAAILGLYVVTDTLGGIGALAVLVFGAVVSNAGPLVAALFRPRGGAVVEAADEDFRAALDDHARTVEITRVLLFTFLGMNLGPPWGLLAMGIVLGLLLVVLRLLAARLVLRGVDDRTFSALALGWPRGMVVAGLAALPHAAAVPGTESLTTLVFAAVATTCVAFGVAVSPLGHAHVSEDIAKEKGPSGHVRGDMSDGAKVARTVAPAATVDEVSGAAAREPTAGAGAASRESGSPAAPTSEARRGGESASLRAAEDAVEPASPGGGGTGASPGRSAIAGDPRSFGGPGAPARETGADPRAGDGSAAAMPGRTAVADAPGSATLQREPMGVLAAVSASLSGGAASSTASERSDPASGTTAVIRGKTLPPEEAVVSGRTVVPEGPAGSGRTVAPEGPALAGQTLTPEEAVVSGRTVVPEGAGLAGKTLLPDAIGGERRGLFAIDMPPPGRTLVPGEPLAGPRTLLPGESSPGTRVAEVPRFAPPGAPRSSERTVLRGSGPGAPELVRHVFVSSPAGTTVTQETSVVLPVTRMAEAPATGLPVRGAPSPTRASEAVTPVAEPEPLGTGPAGDGSPRAPGETATALAVEASPGPERPEVAEPRGAGLEVAVTFVAPEPELPATAEAPEPGPAVKEPALLDLVGEAILPSGHVLKNIVKETGEGGTKEG